VSSLALLREWDLLEHEVVPPLIKVERRGGPRVWSIGSAKDALTVTVAYREFAAAPADDDVKVFLSQHSGDAGDPSFALPDIKCVPAGNRSSFVRRDRRWVAEPEIAEHVILSEPTEPVDLVTVRLDEPGPDSSAVVEHALHQLRQGGQLLLISPEAAALNSDLAGLEPGCGDHRLYRKYSPTRGSRCRRRHGADETPVATGTLAHHQREQELIRDHVRLARSLARRFAHHGEAAEDLDQVAYLALVKAARRFEADREVRFATYATASILGELKRHFRDKTWMLRVPRPVQETYLAVKQARDDLTQDLGTSPSIRQIADHLEVPADNVLEAMEAGDNYWPMSLDVRISDDEPAREIPVTDPSFERSLARIELERLIPTLDDREMLIVKRLYFDSWTQRRVAEEIGVSQMQVSRLLARALAKLQA
jgi:RNA polymerase sigma-B factor